MHLPVKVTPPQSFTSSPPTPPPTTEKTVPVVGSVVAEIETRQSGRSCLPRPWTCYRLTEGEYEELLRRVQRDDSIRGYVDDKLRFDYSPYISRLVLRMPTALHELIISRVVLELQSQLETLAGVGDTPSAKFARQVKSWGSTTLTFPNTDYGRHDPDAQFRYNNARYPGLVIEVSYSQKRKDLWSIVDDYILGSDGDIQVVIVLDIEYLNSKKATLSIWRPGVETNEAGETALVAKQITVDQRFRTETGNPIKDDHAGIRLQLGDFAVQDAVSPICPLTDTIFISAAKLYSYLEEAEQEVSNLEKESGAPRRLQPWTTKRRRQQTPPEELDESRERKFRKNETEALRLAEAEDSSYENSSEEE